MLRLHKEVETGVLHSRPPGESLEVFVDVIIISVDAESGPILFQG